MNRTGPVSIRTTHLVHPESSRCSLKRTRPTAHVTSDGRQTRTVMTVNIERCQREEAPARVARSVEKQLSNARKVFKKNMTGELL